jgi:hypothetical protein
MSKKISQFCSQHFQDLKTGFIADQGLIVQVAEENPDSEHLIFCRGVVSQQNMAQLSEP